MKNRPWVWLIDLLASTLVCSDNTEETAKMAAAKTYYKRANLESLWKDKLTELAKAVPSVESDDYLALVKPCFEQLVWAELNRAFTLNELIALTDFNRADGPKAMTKLSEFISLTTTKLDDELPNCHRKDQSIE